MIFNFRKAEIYKATIFYRFFPAGLLRFYRVLFFVCGLAPIMLTISDKVFSTQFNFSIGWSLIALPLALSVLFFEIFGGYYLKYPRVKSTNNIADLLEFEAARVFDRAFEFSRALGEKELSVKTFLAAMLEDNVMEKLFTRIMPSFASLKKQFRKSLNMPKHFSARFSLFTSQEISPEVLGVLEGALALRDEHGGMRISVLDIMATFFDYSEEFKQFIISQDLDKNDLKELAKWYEHIWEFWREFKKFWSLSNLLRQIPVGRDWVYGYSPHLATFAVNLTDKMRFASPALRLISREKEIDRIEQILSRAGENNVLLVGEVGVGKDRIVNDFVRSSD